MRTVKDVVKALADLKSWLIGFREFVTAKQKVHTATLAEHQKVLSALKCENDALLEFAAKMETRMKAVEKRSADNFYKVKKLVPSEKKATPKPAPVVKSIDSQLPECPPFAVEDEFDDVPQ